MSSWIKIDRQIQNHWIFSDADYFKAWMYLLLNVQWKDTTRVIRKKVIKVPKGSDVLSIRFLANAWGWTPKRVLNFLRKLEEDGMITRTETQKETLVTVVNWDKYQVLGNTDDNTDDNTGDNTDGNKYKKEKKDEEGGEVNEPQNISFDEYKRLRGLRNDNGRMDTDREDPEIELPVCGLPY